VPGIGHTKFWLCETLWKGRHAEKPTMDPADLESKTFNMEGQHLTPDHKAPSNYALLHHLLVQNCYCGCSRTGCWGEYLDLKKEEAGGWRKLYSEKLHNFHYSADIIMVTKSRRMRLVGHVAWWNKKCIQNFRWKICKEETI
jgi:hypothetical protein